MSETKKPLATLISLAIFSFLLILLIIILPKLKKFNKNKKMLLNSKHSNFSFQFPPGFFYDHIEKRYDIFFKRQPIPYRNLTDFMNYTIQSITWPSIDAQTVKQVKKTGEKIFKGGNNILFNTSKDITITFRTTEGFLNYWVMLDQLEEYLKLNKNDKPFLDNFNLFIFDHYGYLISTWVMSQVVYTSISNLELSFASNVPEYRTFDCTFSFTGLEYRRELQ